MSYTRVLLIMNEAEDHNQAFADRHCTALPGHASDMHKGSFKAVGELNDWLPQRGFDGKFRYCNHGVFALASTRIDLKLFSSHLHLLPWLQPTDVQVLVKEPTQSRYEQWALDLDHFKECQAFLNSSDASKPEVRKMIEDAILLGRDAPAAPERKIRLDV